MEQKMMDTWCMVGARQPGQKPDTRGLLNIRDWMVGITAAVVFLDILSPRESLAN